MARAGFTEPDKVAETMAKTKKQEKSDKQDSKPQAAAIQEGQGASAKETPRLLQRYKDVVIQGLIEKFGTDRKSVV